MLSFRSLKINEHNQAVHNGLPFIYISASFRLDGKTYAVYNISGWIFKL